MRAPLLAAVVALALPACALQGLHRSSESHEVPPPSVTSEDGRIFILAPVYFDEYEKPERRKRIRIPNRVVKG